MRTKREARPSQSLAKISGVVPPAAAVCWCHVITITKIEIKSTNLAGKVPKVTSRGLSEVISSPPRYAINYHFFIMLQGMMNLIESTTLKLTVP
jgi:hypothetical protein